MRRRLPGADNSSALLICEIGVGVNNQQNYQSSDHADRMPPLLSVFKTIRHNEMERILEDLPGEIECDTMLGKIALGLLRIPFELQGSTVSYNIVRTIP